MEHCTPEQLALAALREPLPREDDAHLAGCDRCRAEVSALQRSVDALAVPGLAAAGAPVAPPPSVWTAIAAATGVSATPRAPLVESAVDAAEQEPPAGPEPPAGQRGGEVIPLSAGRARRSLRARLLLVAASLVVGAGLGAGALALVQRDQGGQRIAAAALRPIGDDGASGTATVVHEGNADVLEVDLRAPSLTGGYYEVWLADSNLKGMIAVGILHNGKGHLDLPPGVDLGTYRVVDVSAEPIDGDPGHSAVSVARGQLAR